MKRNSQGIVHIFLLIVVVIGIAGIGYYAVKNDQIKTTPQLSPTPTLFPETPTPPLDPTSDWEVFISSQFFSNLDVDFRIRHPETLNKDYADGTYGSSVLIYDSDFELDISMSINQDLSNSDTDMANKFVQDTLSRKPGAGFNCNLFASCESTDYSTDVVSINQIISAGSVKGPGRNENSLQEAYLIRSGSKVIQLLFHFEDYDNTKLLRDQILSTFEFLEKEDTLPSQCDGTCPQYTNYGPNFCLDGEIVPGEVDECGCRGPARCIKN